MFLWCEINFCFVFLCLSLLQEQEQNLNQKTETSVLILNKSTEWENFVQKLPKPSKWEFMFLCKGNKKKLSKINLQCDFLNWVNENKINKSKWMAAFIMNGAVTSE